MTALEAIADVIAKRQALDAAIDILNGILQTPPAPSPPQPPPSPPSDGSDAVVNP